jgi:hypothetical protein
VAIAAFRRCSVFVLSSACVRDGTLCAARLSDAVIAPRGAFFLPHGAFAAVLHIALLATPLCKGASLVQRQNRQSLPRQSAAVICYNTYGDTILTQYAQLLRDVHAVSLPQAEVYRLYGDDDRLPTGREHTRVRV